jgi:hypothetical protein
MSLRRVRCPHCSRLFNVTGITAGTRLRCGGCDIVLSVPAFPPARPLPLFRIAAGAAAGLAAIVVVVIALRPAAVDPPTATGATFPVVRSAATIAPADPNLGIFDDPVTRLKMEIGQEFPGSRFTVSESVRPYVLLLESSDRYVDSERIRDYGRELELAHTAFRRDIADRIGLPPLTDTILPVLVLSSRAAFDRHCERREGKRQPAASKGFYDYTRRRIVTYQDAAVPRDVMLHEGAHQLMHYYQLRQKESRRVHVSFWLQEGLANYYEGFRRRLDGEIALDRGADCGRFPLLRHVATRSEFVPLESLVGLSVDGYFAHIDRLRAEDGCDDADRQAQILYAESWALVHFLRQSGPRHRRVFEGYLQRELAGTASKLAFVELVKAELDLTLPELESQFLRYVTSLK